MRQGFEAECEELSALHMCRVDKVAPLPDLLIHQKMIDFGCLASCLLL